MNSARIHLVDLFSGAGGLSSGFVRAGALPLLAVDADADALATYKSNHKDCRTRKRTLKSVADVLTVLCDTKIESGSVDILVGGPPCQGWSSLGARNSQARRDALNANIGLFLQIAGELLPRAVVMENVVGFASSGGGSNRLSARDSLKAHGYAVIDGVLKAADFGVPQLRQRYFLVGLRTDLGLVPTLPSGSTNTLATVRDAIGDLPSIGAGRSAERYETEPSSKLQRALRGQQPTLDLHVAPAHSVRICQILASLPEDGGSRSDLAKDIAPTSGFHNTYCRLAWDEPATAVTGSAGRVSSGRNAHPRDNRALTPREAARLQTFPDSYRWEGKIWSIYRQIGNSVPPLLAFAVAREVVRALAGKK